MTKPVKRVKRQVNKRPAEVAALPLICAPTYAFLADAGIPHPAAAVVALAIGFAPMVISWWRDR